LPPCLWARNRAQNRNKPKKTEDFGPKWAP